MIANNIFYFEGAAKLVKGDQYKPETQGGWQGKHANFKNNLFLEAGIQNGKLTRGKKMDVTERQ